MPFEPPPVAGGVSRNPIQSQDRSAHLIPKSARAPCKPDILRFLLGEPVWNARSLRLRSTHVGKRWVEREPPRRRGLIVKRPSRAPCYKVSPFKE